MSEAGQNGRDGAQSTGGAYRVLARKYRPRDFSGLIGQEPMVRTLTNAFEAGRIAQAWMLTGVRGVGKTTTARILARALNYKTEAADRPSVVFDALGEHCQAIMEGRHVDVLEMDAASHTGIDDIRDIIEQVRYAPVSARYKVYIIDEVHMLSTQAFNGLLKTLEEPPPHVKFIFATTEIRKVPITVLSRCQRFDLRRVEASVLTSHLQGIARLERIEVADEALAMISRAAEGSVRDSLSLFDQAIAHNGSNEGGAAVSAEAVRDMLGLADRARVIDLFEMLMAGDVAGALGEYRAQYDAGADPVVVLTELAEFNHLVTRLRFIQTAASDVSLTEDERIRGLDFSTRLGVRTLSRTWQMLLKAIDEVRIASRPVSAGEMALIRIAHAADLPTLDEALKSLGEGDGDRTLSMTSPAKAPSHRLSQPSVSRQSAAPSSRPVESSPTPATAPRQSNHVAIASLADIIALAEANRDIKLKVSIRQYLRLVKIEAGHMVVSLTGDAPKSLLTELSTKLKDWTGRNWLVSVSRDEVGAPTLAEQETARRETAFTDARADPAVAAILARFPGAKIIDVRIPEAVAETPKEPTIDPGLDLDDDDL